MAQIVVTIRTEKLDKLELQKLANSVMRTAEYMTQQAGVQERDVLVTAVVE